MSEFILSAFADEIDANLNIQMDVLQEHNISYIEMRGVNGKTITQYSLEEVRQIKRQIADRGFKVSAIASPIGKIQIGEDFAPHLELFKHTLEIAQVTDAPYIRMFSFFMPQDEDPTRYRDEVMRRWSRFAEVAKGSGVILLHENEKGIYGDTPERCLDLLRTINCEYVKAVFDPANFVQCNVQTYPHAYEILKDYVVYMHIKDAVYSDHHVVPAGQGDGCVKEILTTLHNISYEGFLSLEPHLGNFEGFASLEKDAKYQDLPESGPYLFAIASQELKKIMAEIVKGGA